MLNELLQSVRQKFRAGDADNAANSSTRSETLILFYNTMWDQPLELPREPLPDGCEITTDARRFGEAAAVVFHIPSLYHWPVQPKRPGQLWVAWSLECEAHYPQLRTLASMRHFDLTMTYRSDADVTAPYVWYYSDATNLARALRMPRQPRRPAHLAALLISSRIDRSGRIAYATELMRYLDIHSYGKMLQNRQIAEDHGRPSKIELIADYAFTLAFENAVAEDYVTEKFYDPLVVGSVPVYLGAPNVEQFAPGDQCFINTADYPDPKTLAEYLLALQHDEGMYQSYFAWKDRPFRPSFQALLDGQATHPFTRLCHAVKARQGSQSHELRSHAVAHG